MKRINCFLTSLSLLFLLGCDPFNDRQNQTRKVMTQAKNQAKRAFNAYKPEIREIKAYETYQYKDELSDPFQIKGFVQTDEVLEKDTPTITQKPLNINRCQPPKCSPPEPHEKQLLENYPLESLIYVGTMNEQAGIAALIKTPDFGVVSVKSGDYMGLKNGKIQAIKESVIVLQEKIEKNGIWENKKTILQISQ